MENFKNGILSYLTLFTSVGTLLCCALPSLMVSIGLGAVVAGLVGELPFLVWLSERKGYVFLLAGGLLLMSGFLLWKSKDAPCPIDPKLRQACIRGRTVSKYVYIFSVTVYSIGGLFAYVLPVFMA